MSLPMYTKEEADEILRRNRPAGLSEAQFERWRMIEHTLADSSGQHLSIVELIEDNLLTAEQLKLLTSFAYTLLGHESDTLRGKTQN